MGPQHCSVGPNVQDSISFGPQELQYTLGLRIDQLLLPIIQAAWSLPFSLSWLTNHKTTGENEPEKKVARNVCLQGS